MDWGQAALNLLGTVPAGLVDLTGTDPLGFNLTGTDPLGFTFVRLRTRGGWLRLSYGDAGNYRRQVEEGLYWRSLCKMNKSLLGRSDIGIAKHQKGVQTYFLPSEDVYAATLLPVTLEAVLEMYDGQRNVGGD